MSDDAAFHAPIPHLHDPATDLAEDEAGDETPPGGFSSGDDRLRTEYRDEDDGAVFVDTPLSPDL